MRKASIWFMACLLIIVLIAGCDGNIPVTPKSDPSPNVNAEQPAVLPPNSNGGQSFQETMRITTYQATKDAMHLAPETYVVLANDHPAQTALELLTAGTNSQELISVIPPGTKVLSVKIKDHIAYADFNDKIVKNNPGGSTSEMLLVAAIVDTLTEFSEVQKVQILVDGIKADTISGHMDISEPLSRSEKIIKR